MYLKQLFIIVLLGGLLGCAGTAEQDGEAESADRSRFADCIHEPSVRGYRILDEQNLLIDASGQRTYHVGLQHRAFGLRSSMAINFRSPSNRVCKDFSEILYREFMFDGTYESVRIRSIRLLTPEEEEELLIRFGKKEPEIEQTPVPQDVKGAEVEELDTADNE